MRCDAGGTTFIVRYVEYKLYTAALSCALSTTYCIAVLHPCSYHRELVRVGAKTKTTIL